ncbi:MAG: hydroxymethylbilane synthase [Zoogloeaceae bacterium]|jgi:hydroxymethylbilane synthase|nr:hydroxymethylbilane synthase [Zoogloeaceae bacterium]
MNSPARIVIASRESRLALWQAEHIQSALRALYPGASVSILGMTTQGDQILDRPLAQIGGKGLFIKELENALIAGKADLAVHSLKDVPMELPKGFALAAIPARETPLDALVSNRYDSLEQLPEGAIVGTSSLRREALLRRHYPRLAVKSLRGNLDTRLRKLDAGEYDAIVLAAAGLIRLGLETRIRVLLPPEIFLPAPGQGALGIETLDGKTDIARLLIPLADSVTACCVRAERAFSRALGGSCQIPLGGYALVKEGELWLRGFISTPDGQTCLDGEMRGDPSADESLGRALARSFMDRGAAKILAALGLSKDAL